MGSILALIRGIVYSPVSFSSTVLVRDRAGHSPPRACQVAPRIKDFREYDRRGSAAKNLGELSGLKAMRSTFSVFSHLRRLKNETVAYE
jgi:hypothetical protein